MPSLPEYDRLDATDLAALVRRKEVSPPELVEAAIERVEARNPPLNAVAARSYERARQQARGALPEGPFRGVPFLLKDMLAVDGGIRVRAQADAGAEPDGPLRRRGLARDRGRARAHAQRAGQRGAARRDAGAGPRRPLCRAAPGAPLRGRGAPRARQAAHRLHHPVPAGDRGPSRLRRGGAARGGAVREARPLGGRGRASGRPPGALEGLPGDDRRGDRGRDRRRGGVDAQGATSARLRARHLDAGADRAQVPRRRAGAGGAPGAGGGQGGGRLVREPRRVPHADAGGAAAQGRRARPEARREARARLAARVPQRDGDAQAARPDRGAGVRVRRLHAPGQPHWPARALGALALERARVADRLALLRTLRRRGDALAAGGAARAGAALGGSPPEPRVKLFDLEAPRRRLAARRGGGAGEEPGGAPSLGVAVGDAEAHLLQRLGELARAGRNARRALAEEGLRVSEVRRIAELPGQRDGVLRVRLGDLGDEPVEPALERLPGRLPRFDVVGDLEEDL